MKYEFQMFQFVLTKKQKKSKENPHYGWKIHEHSELFFNEKNVVTRSTRYSKISYPRLEVEPQKRSEQ